MKLKCAPCLFSVALPLLLIVAPCEGHSIATGAKLRGSDKTSISHGAVGQDRKDRPHHIDEQAPETNRKSVADCLSSGTEYLITNAHSGRVLRMIDGTEIGADLNEEYAWRFRDVGPNGRRRIYDVVNDQHLYAEKGDEESWRDGFGVVGASGRQEEDEFWVISVAEDRRTSAACGEPRAKYIIENLDSGRRLFAGDAQKTGVNGVGAIPDDGPIYEGHKWHITELSRQQDSALS